ncbi:hypothetical protein ROHU_024752 [Labeo rohita]|uniref:Uncharacterized protein n=1 Tax=Labeo rohita TaxID=84645 RepID=A0A498MKF0_LABRO|nr:hypothetical protein ROHU_024752 [Labeo rohita]
MLQFTPSPSMGKPGAGGARNQPGQGPRVESKARGAMNQRRQGDTGDTGELVLPPQTSLLSPSECAPTTPMVQETEEEPRRQASEKETEILKAEAEPVGLRMKAEPGGRRSQLKAEPERQGSLKKPYGPWFLVEPREGGAKVELKCWQAEGNGGAEAGGRDRDPWGWMKHLAEHY